MTTIQIEEKLRKLPDHAVAEVNDYIEFLLQKYGTQESKKKKFRFDWAGGLSHLKDKYTSVELQHKAQCFEYIKTSIKASKSTRHNLQ